MMDRNREARRAVAMANGLQRRRHRTSNHRDSPEDEGAMGVQEAARLRDRTVKDRDREIRDRERDRERMSRSKRRRADGGGRGGGVDESSEESVNDDEDYVDDGGGGSVGGGGGVSQLNQVHMTSSPVAMSLTSQRKSYPPPTKVYRVTPTWKAPDEMIGVSIPRKARSASTKRSHEWSSCGLLESSSSPMRSDTAAGAGTGTGTRVPSPSSAPMSPSSSNVSMKKKIKPNGVKHRPPKPASKSSPSIQDEIEIEVAEVLYGLMRQTQAPSPTPTPAPAPSSSSKPEPIHDSTAPVTFVAPKRKRPRLYPDEVQPGVPVISPNSNSNSKPESNHPLHSLKLESASPSTDNGGQFNSRGSVPVPVVAPVSVSVSVPVPPASDLPPPISNNGNTMSTPKLEEVASSSSPPPPPQPPKLESSHNQDPLQFSSTSTKPNSTDKENRRGDKFKIDLMAPASPEKEEETGEYNGREVRDEKSMVTEREQDTKSKPNPNVMVELHPNKQALDSNSAAFGIGIGIGIGIRGGPGGGGVELNRAAAAEAGDDSKASVVAMSRSEPHHKMTLSLSSPPPQQQHQLPNLKERSFDLQFDLEKNNDSKLNVQQQPKQLLPKTSSRDDSPLDKPGGTGLPMSVPAGWPGGIASPMGYVGPMQGVVSMDGTTMAPPPIQPTPPHFLLSQPKPKRCATHCHIARSISLHQRMMKISPFWPPVPAAPLFGAKPSNMSLAPSPELHSGRGGVVSLAQESKVQPLAFFPGQPSPVSNSKDKTSQAANVAESPQKKQMLLQPGLPPGAATNMMPAPALFFPMGQQQAAASARPGSGKSQSTASAAASASTLTSLPMGAAVSNAPPAMSFSYPNMNGSEAQAQFMAILGNGSYPFPIPAHVGAAPPYRGSHPQAMPFFNGSFYPSQMLHPSQLQQTQNHQNPGISSAPSTSSHKHLQNQQQRPQGSGPNLGNPNQNSSLQNLQTTKSRDMGGEDSPTTADSRNRPNMSVYGPNFVVPFHSPSFALMPSSLGGGNHGDKKHQQQQQQQQQQQSQHSALNSPFPMSFATINGAATPGLDISSMSMPEAAKYSYQMMAAAAQAAQQGKTDYRGPENGKPVAGDASNLDEERRAMPSRASTGQSIAFSRDTAENAVVDSSTRSLKQQQQQQQQQQQSQILFSKQQQYTSPSSGNTHSKTPSTSNRNVYPDNQTSSTIMGAKFTSNLSGYPSGGPTQSQWKNSVRPNTSQMSTPSITATSSPLNVKSLPQQQGRSQNQTHISFGASQGQQTHSSSHGHATVGSPSNSSISKSTGGSPRTSASNKSLGQQGKNSPSQTQSAQKSSILGSPHIVSSTSSAGKPLLQQPHQQPQLSKQSIQQAQLYFSNYMQANTSAAMVGTGYYLQQQQQQQQQLQQQQLQQRQLQQHMQQQLQGSKSKGSAPPISSTTCSPVTTSDPSKPLGTASQLNAAAANNNNNNNSKGGLHSLGMFQTAQSSGGSHQLTPASFPYLNAVPPGVPVKPSDQKQPAGD